MKVCTLASSSKGNALVVSCGDTHILLDAGISAKRIKLGLGQLGLSLDDLSAILITHEHTDHMAGLATLTKQTSIPVYATCQTEPALRSKAPALGAQFCAIMAGEGFTVGDAEIYPFATPHDVGGSVGYRITYGGASMALATDLGHLTQSVLDGVCGVDLLVAEANHDEDWVRTSPYPYSIQSRILGDYGHLSNETGMELVVRAVRAGTKAVILAHLSPENNTPAHALEVAHRRLTAEGIRVDEDIYLAVAPEKQLGECYHIADGVVEILKQEVVVC